MALQNCHECGHEVSSTAKKCPNCGASVKKNMPKGCATAIVIVIALIVVMIGISSIINSCEGRQAEKARIQNEKMLAEKEAKKTDEFIKNIEAKYQNLLSLFQNKNIDEANKELTLFRKYKQLDYKDVKNIDKTVSIFLLEKNILPKKPENYNANSLTYKRLVDLDPDNNQYKKELEFYKAKVVESKKKEIEKIKGNKLPQYLFILRGDKVIGNMFLLREESTSKS